MNRNDPSIFLCFGFMTVMKLFLLLCIGCAIVPDNAAEAVETRRLSGFQALMDTLVAGDYPAANQICDSVLNSGGSAAAALYARMAGIYARITDYEDSSGRGLFFALSDSCLHRARADLALPGADRAALHYLIGSCYSSKALLLNREGSSLSAIRLLMKSRDEFARAIEADPEFYDAYLGRGAYRYGVATHGSLVGFLPFMPSKSSGWSDMWLAVQRSDFSKWSALTALVWFALEDKEYALADSICLAGLQRFPNCRGFLWPQLSLRVRQERWPEADAIARNLYAQYSSLGANAYDQIGLCLQISQICDRLGRSDEAREWANRGVLTPRTTAVSERRREKLRELAVRAAQ
ncbi:hypothetical protein HZB60_01325 [candidate division KSB1 bacterium]|nr:hypothetical protein [candidate division KSB1 bacterium]